VPRAVGFCVPEITGVIWYAIEIKIIRNLLVVAVDQDDVHTFSNKGGRL
jgi:hypothetical protein